MENNSFLWKILELFEIAFSSHINLKMYIRQLFWKANQLRFQEPEKITTLIFHSNWK